MKKELSKISKSFLDLFIDFGELLINSKLNIRQVRKFLYGGAPDGFYSPIYNLKRMGYISITGTKDKQTYKLTNKGRKAVSEILIKEKIKRQKWDGQWRVLIFDIPEKKRKFRNNLRRTLINLGFYQLQKSVWVCPFDVIDYLYDIIPGFREGDWFQYIEAKHISSQNEIKSFFGL